MAIYNPPIVLNSGFGGFVKRGLVEGIKSLLMPTTTMSQEEVEGRTREEFQAEVSMQKVLVQEYPQSGWR